MIAAGLGYTAPNWVGAALAASALVLAVLSGLLERREAGRSRIVAGSTLEPAPVPASRH
ncbi:MFS transporter [Streptomyces californicus]